MKSQFSLSASLLIASYVLVAAACQDIQTAPIPDLHPTFQLASVEAFGCSVQYGSASLRGLPGGVLLIEGSPDDDYIDCNNAVFPRSHRIEGGPGDDYLLGSNPSGDVIVGGPGRDILLGAGGDDLIDAADGEADLDIWCHQGDDTAIIDPIDPAPQGCETIIVRDMGGDENI